MAFPWASVIGAGVGLAGSLFGGSKGKHTTQQQLPIELQRGLNGASLAARHQFNNRGKYLPGPFPGNQYVPETWREQQLERSGGRLAGQMERGLLGPMMEAGSAPISGFGSAAGVNTSIPRSLQGLAAGNFGRFIPRSGMESLQDVSSGEYLHGGEGFDAAMQAAENRIMPAVQSRFGQAGRSGSGLAAQAMTEGLGNAFADLYGQERGRQDAASGALNDFTMGLGNLQIGAAGLGQNAVGQRLNALMAKDSNTLHAEALRQGAAGQAGGLANTIQVLRGGATAADLAAKSRVLGGKMREHYEPSMRDQATDDYVRRIQSLMGGAPMSQSQPVYSNPLMSGLGAAMVGSQVVPQIWNQFGSGTGGASADPYGVMSPGMLFGR